MKSKTANKPRTKKISILVAVFILFAGILLGGYLVLKSGSGRANQLGSILGGQTSGSCQPDPYQAEKDSDNDNLKDWQEVQMYKSDACKADTDGDGYLDGEEVASGYNPTKKSPNDKLDEKSLSPRPAPTTLTGQFIAKFIEKFGVEPPDLTSMANTDLLDLQADNLVAGALNDFVKEHENELNFITTVPEQKIKVIQNTDSQTINAYLLEIQNAIANNLSSLDKNFVLASFVAAKNATKTKNFSELDKFIQASKKTSQTIEKISVPVPFKDFHLKLLSWLGSYNNILASIKTKDIDPLKTMSMIKYWPQIQQIRKDLTDNLTDLLIKYKKP